MKSSITISLLLLASAIPLVETGSCPTGYASAGVMVRADEERTGCHAKGQGTVPINDARSEPFRLIRGLRVPSRGRLEPDAIRAP
jgi:hypothetical protein